MHLYTDPNAAHVTLCLCLFLSEHNLSLPKDCPIGDTSFNASDDSSSQIDYFFVSQHPELNEAASIEGIHHLNLSDNTHITLCVNV